MNSAMAINTTSLKQNVDDDDDGNDADVTDKQISSLSLELGAAAAVARDS